MSYVVYGLEDPRDSLFHYVGITDNVYTRFLDHIKGSAGNIQKNGWIFECRQANIMIAMKEFERIEMHSKALELAEAIEREKYWIRYYLNLGHPLSNKMIATSILREQAKLERLARKPSIDLLEKYESEAQNHIKLVVEGNKEVRTAVKDVESRHNARLERIRSILSAFPGVSASQAGKLAGCSKATAHRYICEVRMDDETQNETI